MKGKKSSLGDSIPCLVPTTANVVAGDSQVHGSDLRVRTLAVHLAVAALVHRQATVCRGRDRAEGRGGKGHRRGGAGLREGTELRAGLGMGQWAYLCRHSLAFQTGQELSLYTQHRGGAWNGTTTDGSVYFTDTQAEDSLFKPSGLKCVVVVDV